MTKDDKEIQEELEIKEAQQENANNNEQKEQEMTQDNTREVDEQKEELDFNEKLEQNEELEQNGEIIDETVLFKNLHKEIEDMKSLAQRTQADFINYKKRVEREKGELTVFANERIVTEMLTIIDNFERALESEKENCDTSFFKGVEMILKQFVDTLSKFGLEKIEADGQDFDPNFHHAVMQEEADEPDKVIEVIQKGYKLKDRVIRPSMVKVSK